MEMHIIGGFIAAYWSYKYVKDATIGMYLLILASILKEQYDLIDYGHFDFSDIVAGIFGFFLYQALNNK